MVVRLLNQERERRTKKKNKRKKKSRARKRKKPRSKTVFRTTTSAVNQKCARLDRSVFQPRSIFARFAFVKTARGETKRRQISLSDWFFSFNEKFSHPPPGDKIRKKKTNLKRAREYLSLRLRRSRTSLSLSHSLYI